MKTQETNTGNNNNQAERVLLRSAAVIISFVLISFTVSAQGFWKQLLTNNSFGQVALLMVEETGAAEVATELSVPAAAESSTFYFAEAMESELEVEAWMTDDVYFGAYTHLAVPATEPGLELESWMMDEGYFNSHLMDTDEEKELELEAWMTDNDYWSL
ncbi:hypothetical protein [Sunxiuqinia sp. sy24]|uniref:hypothetical protein n=1 Tax=Sunxiuqinia sp. sy24 TaxID=3461495 RepID=UPI0040454057